MTDDTLRNQLLAAALQGALAGPQFGKDPYFSSELARQNLARSCIAIVDTMMAELERDASPFKGAV